jgi:hypothetical protein
LQYRIVPLVRLGISGSGEPNVKKWQSSTSVSVTTPGYTGDAARATSDADRGTYTVVGNTLVMKGTKGQFTFDIQIEGNRLAAGGKTYLRN